MPIEKLLLKCNLSPGDIVMLTAAVRDLHRCYPGRFLTDVRTACPDIWENNPYLSVIKESDPEARVLECTYPLINYSNTRPYHCLNGFIAFLNERLGLQITPTAFKGDIHLSAQEKAWFSQVHELTGEDTPFWLVSAGGKYDLTIKWWETERYQQVVDHFRGRIQFVQIGKAGHHHNRLESVLDLRGQTTLRELIRLVYHSQGALCPVTGLMHLCAAVEPKRQLGARPCVVVAGGREPAHWEAYPGHQFIHTLGALDCCSSGGCWRDRTAPLGDGDPRDRRGNRCVDVVGNLPKCMDLIAPEEVIRRIESYFDGGRLKFLSRGQQLAAARGVAKCSKNPFDELPLNLHSAALACSSFIKTIPPYPNKFQGRGIVICGGGVRYFTGAWVCINMLRHLGCRLPIQFWFLGKKEMDAGMKHLLSTLDVECIDAQELRKQFPARRLGGWELKAYALLHSRFREVLLLDADNVPVRDPEYLFETKQFKETGAIFWPDYNYPENENVLKIWRSCRMRAPNEREFETGQILVNKERCWDALCLTMWFNENSDFYYQYIHGDKETFHLAFRKLKKNYALVPKPIHGLYATMCQHDFEGRRLFQHRNLDKYDLFLANPRVKGFWFEDQCRAYVKQLQRLWDGKLHHARFDLPPPRRLRTRPTIDLIILTVPSRKKWLARTLSSLSRTDWSEEPGIASNHEYQKDDPDEQKSPYDALPPLSRFLQSRADYLLLIEDDLDFNRHLRHNLFKWLPLSSGKLSLASLYNPNVREMACDLHAAYRVVNPSFIRGSQALLLSKAVARAVVRNWEKESGSTEFKISRFAPRVARHVFYHAPSLVQHMAPGSNWPGLRARARDFDPDWRAR